MMYPYDELLLNELGSIDNNDNYVSVSLSMSENDYNRLNSLLKNINKKRDNINRPHYTKKEFINMAIEFYIKALKEIVENNKC